MTWTPGDVVVLREVLGGRIRSARPLLVLDDGPEALAGFLAPRSRVAWPRLVDDAQSQTPDQGWRLALEEWHGPGCLFVLPTGEAYAAVLFLDAVDGRPLGWKVDFLAPPRRHAAGLDTLDWALDLLVSADLSTVTVKDEDDLAQLELAGLLGDGGADRVRAARRHVEDRLAARAFPFTGRWATWRPPPGGVAALELPEGWDRLSPAGPDRRGTPASGPESRPGSRPAAGRSASGTRLLDEAGRTFLDLDLAGGVLLHGHAHPRISEAIARQAPLGLGPSAGRGLVGVLADRLADRFGPIEAVAWAGSGDEAWWRAVRAARRATGRRAVACWTAAPPLGGGECDADVVLLPDDAGAALAQLADGAEHWAAVVVDPLVLSAMSPEAASMAAVTAALPLPLASAAPTALVIADERRTLGAGPGGGCGRLGVPADLVVLGPSLFGGLGGGAVGGGVELVLEDAALRARSAEASGGPDGGGHIPATGDLHPVLAAAALATLQLASPTALAEMASRAEWLRARSGAPRRGLGGAFPLPPAATPEQLAAHGLLVDGSGWAWLATVSGGDDVQAVAAAFDELR